MAVEWVFDDMYIESPIIYEDRELRKIAPPRPGRLNIISSPYDGAIILMYMHGRPDYVLNPFISAIMCDEPSLNVEVNEGHYYLLSLSSNFEICLITIIMALLVGLFQKLQISSQLLENWNRSRSLYFPPINNDCIDQDLSLPHFE